MKTQTSFALLAALCAILLSACAGGPEYSRNKNSAALSPAKDKALVLIFWRGGMAGAATKWTVFANEKVLTDNMRRGAFYSYQANPGELRLATKMGWNWASLAGANLVAQIKKDQVAFQLAPNETYYMEMAFGTWREKIKQVSKEEGEKGIKDCHWINPQ